MSAAPKRPAGRLRQIRVVPVRPRGTPREAPPVLVARDPAEAAKATSAFPKEPVPFKSLGLPPDIQQALDKIGYTMATEVQALAIPKARAGKDLIVQSRTGTGKTAAFGIPIIEKVDANLPQVQALVVCPARELAMQVAAEIGRLGASAGVTSLSIYGGDPMPRQVEGLRRGAQVVVGTPGRLLDHLRQGTMKLNHCRILVLDEADQMLDMGFEKEMNQILQQVPKDRQTLMFSATIPSAIEAIASRHQKDPERLMLSRDSLYVADVLHLFYIVTRMGKTAALYKLIEFEDPASSMIFCNTRAEVRTVCGSLTLRGLPAAMLSSDLPQKKRETVLRRFRNKELKHLVATDVAARGIDIEDLSHVFIYSSPDSPEQYIHRAGRTGRIGKTGKAISLVSGFDLMNFNRLVKANNLKAYECDLPSDEEVARKEVRRIVETLKGLAEKMTPEDRAEFEVIAQGILNEEDKVAIIAYLLHSHFTEEAGREVLDEGGGAEADVKPPAATAQPAAPEQPPSGGAGAGTGRRRRRRRRSGGSGGGGIS